MQPSRKPRIAFVTTGNFRSHATLKRATGMGPELQRFGFEVFLLMEDDPSNREKVALECNSVDVIWHPGNKSGLSERLTKQKSIDIIHPDIVWVCGLGVRNLIFRKRGNRRILVDHSELYSETEEGWLRKRVYGLIEKWSSRYYDGHIVASRYLEKYFTGRVPERNNVCPVHYSPYAIQADPHSERMNDPNDSDKVFTFAYMGSFVENYGFWLMLQASKILAEKGVQFQLIMGGRGTEEAAGRRWILENGLQAYVEIAGYIKEKNLQSFLGQGDAFICPMANTIQDWARCPSKLFLYMPYRKPIITCRIGEAYELLGSSGCYYRENDAESLADKMREVSKLDFHYSPPEVSNHSYRERTRQFLDWLRENFGLSLA